MLEPSSSEDEGGDEGTVEDVSEPPTVSETRGQENATFRQNEDTCFKLSFMRVSANPRFRSSYSRHGSLMRFPTVMGYE